MAEKQVGGLLDEMNRELAGQKAGEIPLSPATPSLADDLTNAVEARAESAPILPGSPAFGLKMPDPVAPEVMADNLSQAFKRSSTLTPDQTAEILSLSKATGLPEPFVHANLADVKNIAAYPDPGLPELAQTHPGTSTFLAEPANMALAKDDVQGLKKLEESLTDLWPDIKAKQLEANSRPWGAWDTFWQNDRPIDARTGLAWLSGAPGQAWDASRAQDKLSFAYSQLLLEGERPELLDEIKRMKVAQVQMPKAESYLEQMLVGGTAQIAQYRDMIPDIGWPALAAGAGMYGVTLAATKSPALAAQAATGGMKLGAGMGAFYSMFKLEGGSAMADLMELRDTNTGKPVDFNLARGAATVTGIVNAGIEGGITLALLNMFGVTGMTKFATDTVKRQFVKEAVVKSMGLPSTAKLLTTIGAKATGAWLMESGQEGAQRLVSIWAEEFAKDIHNAKAGNFIQPRTGAEIGADVRQETIDASASFLPLMGLGAGAHMRYSAVSLAKAKVVEQKLTEFKDKVLEQRLATRRPEAVEQAVRDMTGAVEGQPAPPVYMAAEAYSTYFQGENEEEGKRLLEHMGISQDQFAQALALKGDIAMPTDKIATGLAQTKHWDALTPDMKINAFDISQREALGIDREAEQIQIQELAQAQTQAAISQEDVDRFAGELLATGRVNKEQALKTAQIYGHLAQTLTQGGKETQRQWFDRNKVRVQGGTFADFEQRQADLGGMTPVQFQAVTTSLIEELGAIAQEYADTLAQTGEGDFGSDDFMTKISQALESRNRIVSLLVTAERPLVIPTEYGKIFLHKSSKPGVEWQATVIRMDGTPTGDAQYGSAAEAFRDVLDGVPPSRLVEAFSGSVRQYFQSVYHGSPYRFDKFTLDHIGSGEGAQAYGWGLYFAGNKEVAEWYREKLSKTEGKPPSVFVDGVEFDPDAYTEDFDLRDALNKAAELGSIESAEVFFRAEAKEWAGSKQSHGQLLFELNSRLADVAEKYRGKVEIKEVNKGQLYEVTIPDDHTMLDWDKPLSEQPEQVKKALGDEGGVYKKGMAFNSEAELRLGIEGDDGVTKADGSLKKGLTIRQGSDGQWNIFDDGLTGEKLYREIAQDKGSDKAASEYLKSIGIPGLRYLDGTSRSKGEGHHNYVVFDDAQIVIDKTHYQTKRGAISFESLQTLISIFEKGNVSTAPHELGHLYLTELEHLALNGTATAQQAKDLELIREWTGETGAQIGVKGQEQFADGFLNYLRDGKAPTQELAEVFASFRRWLVALYKAAKGSGVKISPEMREVYDRMIVVQEQLDGARNQYSLEAMFAGETALDESVLTTQELAAYESLANSADLAADIEMQKYQESERRKYKATLVEHFNEELKGNIAYRLVTYLTQGYDPMLQAKPDRKAKDYKPGPKLNLYSAKYLFGENVTESVRPGILSKSSTYTVESAMVEFGLERPEDVLTALQFRTTEKRNAFVESGLAAFDKDWRENGTPWANELQEKRMDAEARMLTRLAKNFVPATMDGIKRLVGRKVEAMSVEQLQANFDHLKALVAKVGQDIKTEKYMLAVALKFESQEALREQRAVNMDKVKALRSQWAERVAQANERRRIALSEIRERMNARGELVKMKKLASSIYKAKGMDWDYREQALAIVQRFGLGTERMAPAQADRLPLLMQFVQAKGIEADALAEIPAWLYSEPRGGQRSVMAMTIGQMRELRNALVFLKHRGMTEAKLIGFGHDLEIATVVEKSVETGDKLQKGQKMLSRTEREQKRMLGIGRNIKAQLIQFRYQFDAFDGFTNHGPNSVAGNTTVHMQYPLDRAESGEQADKLKIAAKMEEIFKPFMEQDLEAQFEIPGVPMSEALRQEWGGKWDRPKILMVALNLGNEGNLRAIMQGYGWEMEHLQAITERLTAEEWQMVQQTWDAIDELFPEIDRVHKLINGTPLMKVEAQPLQTPAGLLRGGYFPLIFDRRLSDRAEFLGGMDKLMNDLESTAYADELQHQAAIIRKSNPVAGFAKNRVGSNLPPLLSLRVLSSHLDASLHYVHFAVPLRDNYKMIVVPEFRAAWVKAFGEESYMALGDWLKLISRPKSFRADGMDLAYEWARKMNSIQALGLSFGTGLLQLSSAPISWQEIGAKQFFKGVKIMMDHSQEASDAAETMSTYMASRRDNIDTVLSEQAAKMGFDDRQVKWMKTFGVHVTERQFHNFMYSFLQFMDSLISKPTWHGAYDLARNGEAKMDHEAAVQFADEKVKRAQASGGLVDVALFLKKPGIYRVFSAFMSFSVNLTNNQAYFVRGWREGMISDKDFAHHVLLTWALPPILSAALRGWVRGEPWPEARDMFFEIFGYLFSGLPFIRDISPALEFGGSSNRSAVGQAIETVVKTIKRTTSALDDNEREGEWLAAGHAVVDLIGFVSGIPTRPIWRFKRGVEDLAEGKTVNPLRLVVSAPKEKK